MMCSFLKGQEYRAPQVIKSVFSEELGMLGREREGYAKNLAAHAGRIVAEQKRGGNSLSIARRLLGLSLHLAPKNRSAVVMNRRLQQDDLRSHGKVGYSAAAFSGLLFERAKFLSSQKGGENELLSRCFIELAVLFDSGNQAAVRKMERQKIEFGSVNWNQFIGH